MKKSVSIFSIILAAAVAPFTAGETMYIWNAGTVWRVKAIIAAFLAIVAPGLTQELARSTSPDWIFRMTTQGRPPLPGEESGWVWHNPLPQGNTLTDLHLAGPGVVLAAGSGGSFLATEDDGAHWKRVKNAAGTYQQINDVFFLNDTLAWAAGENNTVFLSADGGKCWFPVRLPEAANWNAVHFVNPSVGWLAGYSWRTVNSYGGRVKHGIIAHTVDAGRTWKNFFFTTLHDDFDSIIYALSFLTAQKGFAVGHKGGVHTIYQTDDGGETWSEQVISEGPGKDLLAVHFADAYHGWIAGKNGTLLHTEDQGENWLIQTSGTTQPLNDIFFIDTQHGWAAGDAGIILFTNDGGLHWQAAMANMTQNLLTVEFSDPTNGWAAGAHGEILRSRDGGRTWTLLFHTFTRTHLEEMIFTDAQTGWIVGTKGALFKTTDGGQNWITKQSGVTNDLRRIQFLNADTGWIAGSHTLLRTTNGGEDWSRLLSWSGFDYGSTTLQFINAKVGMVINGGFIRTEDSGSNWFVHYAGIAGPKHNIHFFDADTGLVFGEWSGGGGQITMTTDGGKTWKLVGEAPVPAWDVFFLDRKIGWVVGGSGVTKTENGGLSWRRTAQSPVRARAVHFVDSELGYIAGENGSIFFTTNGGEEWQQLKSGTSLHLRSVFFTDTYTGWIAGDEGTLLKTTTGGFDFFERICTEPILPPPPPKPPEPPVTFVLYQNIPNPFKDFTTIDYVMEGRGHVMLRVYDILGRHVRTLVDAVQGEEDIYTVLWHGENDAGKRLPAGIYFYRFEAGRLTQTKKMILLH
ncbi:T9SS type A sorting domain-containing protein [candidate division KSB1 bacterium]|nr:YCF48-related protein [bacterium]NUM67702.1 T9SS type A sorting domain-containing protein [candidate division KSB1 bacterium]